MSPHGPEMMGEFDLEQYGEKIPEQSFELKKSYDLLSSDYAEKKVGIVDYKKQIDVFSKKIKTGAKILDLGCGLGENSGIFKKMGFDVVALDLSEKMIKKAEKKNLGIEYMVSDFFEVDFEQDFFDAIWCPSVFSHIPSKWDNRFFEKIKYILKPNGILFISSQIVDSSTESWEKVDTGKEVVEMFNKKLTEERMEVLLYRYGFSVLSKKYNKSNGRTDYYCKDFEY